MHTRYRLPARAADGLRVRLATVRSELLDGALEAALEQAGARPEEEICVRRLHVPVRLRGVRGDSALAADWAAAITAALTATLSRGGDDTAVRYGSRMHAWIDCALGVARNDLGRAWAWRRLGLWRETADLSAAGAAAELVRGLAFAPEAVVPVLLGLADQGALNPLARQLDAPSWTLLAAAALDAHEAPRILLNWPAPAAAPSELAQSAAATAVDPVGRPGPDHSHGSPLLTLREVAGPQNVRAIAVLVLLATDPALGRLELATASRRVDACAERLLDAAPAPAERSQRAETPELRGPDSGQPVASTDRPVTLDRLLPPGARVQTTGARPETAAGDAAGHRYQEAWPPPDQGPTTGVPASDPADPAPPGTLPVRVTGSPDPVSEPGSAPPVRREAVDPQPADPALKTGYPSTETSTNPGPGADREAHSSLPARQEGRTDWGGLLLLLNLLGPAGVLDPYRPLPGRTLRWTLHRLALALVPVAADDPAALAFAGLGPNTRPPSSDGPDVSEPEGAAIADLRERIVRCLHATLGAGAEAPEAVLVRVCRRPAMILADPGWIEVSFPLDTLSTELRRAGLDLNPDWLPWLGAVVRFSYE